LKKVYLSLILIAFVIAYCTVTFAQNVASVTAVGNSPDSSQVVCGSTPTLLYRPTQAGWATNAPYGRVSIWFENQSNVPVYIAPRSDISTSNAAILLTIQGHTFNFDRTTGGNVTWYCITASGSATVGVLEEK